MSKICSDFFLKLKFAQILHQIVSMDPQIFKIFPEGRNTPLSLDDSFGTAVRNNIQPPVAPVENSFLHLCD